MCLCKGKLMSPIRAAEFNRLMDDFVREQTRTTGLLRFQRDESLSCLIAPVQPVRLHETSLLPSLEAWDVQDLHDETEVDDDAPTLMHSVHELIQPEYREHTYWQFLSSQMRTVLQSILNYSELIEEDLVDQQQFVPLANLLRIRSASTELLEMAEQIEELLIMEQEKRHVAEKLGALTRHLTYAVDQRAVFAALLSSIASLFAFREACVMQLDEGEEERWQVKMRWGKYQGSEHENLIQRACHRARENGKPCVQSLGHGESAMLFPIQVNDQCEGILLLRGVFERVKQSHQAGIIMAFITQVEKALDAQRELDQIKRMARYDGLTGALTRRAFFEATSAHEKTRSLIMLDIDHFKSINDTHGHQAGDEVLREVICRVQLALREGDLIGRYGGEEFAIFLAVEDLTIATEVAERIRLAISDEPIELPTGESIRVTASLGVVTGNAPLDRATDKADQLLYEAKRGGRNQVRATCYDIHRGEMM